ncbi:unnamed protein product, partial [Prorocentrum cordatum]
TTNPRHRGPGRRRARRGLLRGAGRPRRGRAGAALRKRPSSEAFQGSLQRRLPLGGSPSEAPEEPPAVGGLSVSSLFLGGPRAAIACCLRRGARAAALLLLLRVDLLLPPPISSPPPPQDGGAA